MWYLKVITTKFKWAGFRAFVRQKLFSQLVTIKPFLSKSPSESVSGFGILLKWSFSRSERTFWISSIRLEKILKIKKKYFLEEHNDRCFGKLKNQVIKGVSGESWQHDSVMIFRNCDLKAFFSRLLKKVFLVTKAI